MAVTVSDYESILALVRSWPASQRFSLVQDVLVTLAPTERQPQQTLDRARGLLATEKGAPTDEQIAEWRDAHRMERYGA